MELSKGKQLPHLANEFECTACLACENACPKSAIDHYLAEDGHVYVKVDSSKCIGCLRCQQVCKKSRMYYGENNVLASKLYAAWTNNEKDRANATSGGVFAALARTVLESGGCVVGAELNGFECKHTVIYSVDDIYRLQGSKYIASSMEDIYKIIAAELPYRDVLFSGLGCQCAGVLAFFEEFKTSYKLYTVDLVCGGSPSRILIDKFKEQYPNVKGFLSFRSKDKYELKVKTDIGEEVFSEKTLPLHGFNCGLTNRYSCYDCQYAKAHRRTDITIGDLWDYSTLTSEHQKGISMAIIHSINGKKLFENSDITATEINWKGALLHNKRTIFGKDHIFNPRRKICVNKKKMNTDRFTKLYTMDIKPNTFGLFLFRLYRYLMQKWITRRRRKEIANILS